MLTRVSPQELGVLLAKTAKVWPTPADWNETAEFYVEALEDMPADLVHSALKHCRLTLKWFPKPAELREPVQRELERRQTVLRRLKAMQQRAKLGDVAAPVLRAVRLPAETEAAERAAEQARAVLDNTTLKRVPGYSEDRKQRDPVSLAAAVEATERALAARRAQNAARHTASETLQTRSVDADAPGGAA